MRKIMDISDKINKFWKVKRVFSYMIKLPGTKSKI